MQNVFKRLVDIKNTDYQRDAALKSCQDNIKKELDKRHEYCDLQKSLALPNGSEESQPDAEIDELFQEDIQIQWYIEQCKQIYREIEVEKEEILNTT